MKNPANILNNKDEHITYGPYEYVDKILRSTEMATENALCRTAENSTYSVFRTCDASTVMRKNTINSPSRPMDKAQIDSNLKCSNTLTEEELMRAAQIIGIA